MPNPTSPALNPTDLDLFPKLTPEQITRIAAHGQMRLVETGEVLLEHGARVIAWFLVTDGACEIVSPSSGTQTLISNLGPGQFTGEVTMLSGRRALNRIRAIQPGEVVELDRGHLLSMLQTDSELGEILLRSFI